METKEGRRHHEDIRHMSEESLFELSVTRVILDWTVSLQTRRTSYLTTRSQMYRRITDVRESKAPKRLDLSPKIVTRLIY